MKGYSLFKMVKVISGIYKGRNLLTPEKNTKPTKGSVKEAIFSSIGLSVNDAIVLDLFSGSGAFGIEALSRGAKHCIFNDIGREQQKILRNNIMSLKITNYELFNFDYNILLNSLNKDKKIDIVFVDPPYLFEKYAEIVEFFIKNNLLNSKGIIVLESNHFLDLDNYNEFFEIKVKKYGYTIVSVLRSKK